MKYEYKNAELTIIQFDIEDVITTSDTSSGITDITDPKDKFLDPNETLPVNP